MAAQITQYRCEVRKNLRCGADSQKRLLGKLDRLLDTYTEEHDKVSIEGLITAFGSPEEMARTLMFDVTSDELAQYRKKNKIKKAILCALLAAFIAFTVWLYFFKEVGLTSHQQIITIDENTDSTHSIIDEEHTP